MRTCETIIKKITLLQGKLECLSSELLLTSDLTKSEALGAYLNEVINDLDHYQWVFMIRRRHDSHFRFDSEGLAILPTDDNIVMPDDNVPQYQSDPTAKGENREA